MVYMLIFHFLLQYLGQQLDMNWTRQILDSSCPLGLLSPFHSTWMKSGQIEDSDRVWTKTRLDGPATPLDMGIDIKWALPEYLMVNTQSTNGPFDGLWTNPGIDCFHTDLLFPAHKSRTETGHKLDETDYGQNLYFI